MLTHRRQSDGQTVFFPDSFLFVTDSWFLSNILSVSQTVFLIILGLTLTNLYQIFIENFPFFLDFNPNNPNFVDPCPPLPRRPPTPALLSPTYCPPLLVPIITVVGLTPCGH